MKYYHIINKFIYRIYKLSKCNYNVIIIVIIIIITLLYLKELSIKD